MPWMSTHTSWFMTNVDAVEFASWPARIAQARPSLLTRNGTGAKPFSTTFQPS